MHTKELSMHLEHAPLFRVFGLPQHPVRVCLVTMRSLFPRINDFIEANPDLKVEYIANPISSDVRENETWVTTAEMVARAIPVGPIESIFERHDLSPIVYLPDWNDCFYPFYDIMVQRLTSFYLIVNSDIFYAFRCEYNPDYYVKNREALAETYSSLFDDASRSTLAGRIKSIVTGNSGYTPIACYRQYCHPACSAAVGDVVIDAGIGNDINTIRDFSTVVGPSGKVFSFEPIPRLARHAVEAAIEISNSVIRTQGLGGENSQVVFADLDDASRSYQAAEAAGMIDNIGFEHQRSRGNVPCSIVKLDDLIDEIGGKVDLIKLDVEGGELQALQGAEQCIASRKPKLMISMYHKPEDNWEIPRYIRSIAPDYRLWLGHHMFMGIETVLYAAVE